MRIAKDSYVDESRQVLREKLPTLPVSVNPAPSFPVKGSLAYDTLTNTIWYANDLIWQPIGGGPTPDDCVWFYNPVVEPNGSITVAIDPASTQFPPSPGPGPSNVVFPLPFVSTESGVGNYFLFDSVKGAIRAGISGIGSWVDSNRGVGSAAFGSSCTVSGATSFASGFRNQMTGMSGVVFGELNQCAGDFNGILSGTQNIIIQTATQSVICGGLINTINSSLSPSTTSIIGGGNLNVIDSSTNSIVGGGLTNVINNSANCTISGGTENVIFNTNRGTVAGGGRNGIVGGNTNAIAGGGSNGISNSTSCSIGGGFNNNIYGTNLTSQSCAINGGDGHSIESAARCSILGGQDNAITNANNSFIAGGISNVITGGIRSGLLSGGNSTMTNATYSAMISGNLNTMTTTDNCTIAGDEITINASDHTFVFGSKITTSTMNNSFVFNDGSNTIASLVGSRHGTFIVQNGIRLTNDGSLIDTVPVKTNTILDMATATKAVQMPQLTTAQRNALAPAPGLADGGMLIFNTTTSQMNYWTGSAWTAL